MARRKITTNKQIQKAEGRMNGSKSINPNLTLGDDLTMEGFIALLKSWHTEADIYNTMLSALDRQGNKVGAIGIAINLFSERWLMAVGVKYGFDSDEYEMAGGTRKSERKRPKRNSGGNVPTT